MSDSNKALLKLAKQKFGDKAGEFYVNAALKRGKEATYDNIGLFFAAANQEERRAIAEELKDGVVGWDGVLFKAIKKDIAEERVRVTKPPEVVEGEVQCRKCMGKKCWFYQKQVRSADEGMTTFYTCTTCGNRWTVN